MTASIESAPGFPFLVRGIDQIAWSRLSKQQKVHIQKMTESFDLPAELWPEGMDPFSATSSLQQASHPQPLAVHHGPALALFQCHCLPSFELKYYYCCAKWSELIRTIDCNQTNFNVRPVEPYALFMPKLNDIFIHMRSQFFQPIH